MRRPLTPLLKQHMVPHFGHVVDNCRSRAHLTSACLFLLITSFLQWPKSAYPNEFLHSESFMPSCDGVHFGLFFPLARHYFAYTVFSALVCKQLFAISRDVSCLGAVEACDHSHLVLALRAYGFSTRPPLVSFTTGYASEKADAIVSGISYRFFSKSQVSLTVLRGWLSRLDVALSMTSKSASTNGVQIVA